MSDRIEGFAPVYDAHSRVLILGSFPSVQSRRVEFYYGNRQNRFWGMLFSFFGENLQDDTAAKRAFLARRRIALWDVVTACRIRGSADASIRDAEIADVPRLLREAPVELILCNGTAAYSIFCSHFADCGVRYLRMPSTSPANPRYRKEPWFAALGGVFGDPHSTMTDINQ